MLGSELLGDGLVAVTGDGGHIVCERCRAPRNVVGRMRGLLGRSELPLGEGFLVRRAPAIHTFFMRFPIDAVFLDRDMVVIGIESNVPPWRIVSRRNARAVLELPAGEGVHRGIRLGERLTLSSVRSHEEEDKR
jgi:uncharacterized membrane protein (UPF0127 family)